MLKKTLKYLSRAFLIILIGIIICALIPLNPSSSLMNDVDSTLIKYSSNFNTSPKYTILIDYSKPVFMKRLWVIENKTKKVILNSHVSHARKSGLWTATKLSNVPGSNLSCNGVFKTSYSYESNFGKGIYKIGMRIKGLDKGINHNALKRNIVFHCSYGPYSSGCFMSFPKINKKIIDLTSNGNLVIVR